MESNFESYVVIDNDLVCHAPLSDEDIINDIIFSDEEDMDRESDESEVMENAPVHMEVKDALINLSHLRSYFQYKNLATDHLENIEELIFNSFKQAN